MNTNKNLEAQSLTASSINVLPFEYWTAKELEDFSRSLRESPTVLTLEQRESNARILARIKRRESTEYARKLIRRRAVMDRRK